MRRQPSNRILLLTSLSMIWLLVGCSSTTPEILTTTKHGSPTATWTIDPTMAAQAEGLTQEEIASLSSLEKFDDYPLYSMHYYGAYTLPELAAISSRRLLKNRPFKSNPLASPSGWSCSLFAALGDRENMLFGRNFDWQFSPAILLFTDPPDGYASVSMVDFAYLGFNSNTAGNLLDLPLNERSPLLDAPALPFDGMNEYGLVVGMAAVPPGDIPVDPDKPDISSLEIIREILDHAKNLEEALAIFQRYEIIFDGPPIHYLLATPAGDAILVEYYQGEMIVTPNQSPWHQATNFLRAADPDTPEGRCWRYDAISKHMRDTGGNLTAQGALDLLSTVAQENTQWSVVYGMNDGQVNVVMERKYDRVHTFYLNP